jgi:hypothetical protein
MAVSLEMSGVVVRLVACGGGGGDFRNNVLFSSYCHDRKSADIILR